MKTIKMIFINLAIIFVLSLVVSLVIWFFGNVLMGYEFAYRKLFWPMFIGASLIEILFEIIFCAWMLEYKKQIMFGQTKEASFDRACENIKFRPPKFILRGMEPLLYRMLPFVK